MKIRGVQAIGLLAAWVAIGAGLGWLAGPALSRSNRAVLTAEELWRETSAAPAGATLRTDAFRHSGAPPALLYEQARSIRSKFQLGGALFGLWCALVAGLSVLAALHERPRRVFEPDPAHCVACGRCFMSCPVERERLSGK